MSATPEKKVDEFGDSYKRSQNEVLFNTREAVLKEAGEHSVNVRLANPLLGLPFEKIDADVSDFAATHGLEEYREVLLKGALCAQAQASGDYESITLLTEEDRAALRHEKEHRWSQPFTLYWLAICCSVAAAVQGADESVINGALLFFPVQFGIGCSKGSNDPLCTPDKIERDQWLGVTNSWRHMFIARLVLGLGIGPKSATVPMFAAEVPHITGLNWRLMMGSAAIPALFVMVQVMFCPESPRWLMKKGKYQQAMQSFLRLRNTPLLAARDLYFAHCMLQEEEKIRRSKGPFPFLELFTVPRNLRATIGATIVMFGQQFCGVNVIAYYSSSIIKNVANASDINALLGSWGFGMLNFLFAIPAWYTIDTFGRRNLLLVTLPFMAIFLLITGFAFWIPSEQTDAKLGVVLMGIYAYACFYSPGFGPVPFTYAAEAFPLYIRELGMTYSTVVLWFFNSVLAITWFRMEEVFKPQGAFGWYAAWCVILWILTFFLLPETKALTLEELDIVFSVPTKKHASYQFRQIPYYIKRNILFQKGAKKEQLYTLEDSVNRA
ncbi:uncharacterized protein MJAP1_001099 [Malassezia japonica]|uniref:Major facilitator superfamily (MFS) profile domain-containing protein n=1 Tax=Malassezia japonica TaxID=223818 RepID=A0AAF0EWA9_9BASI|nr:uncharacterized protein MJAP1_001099 [Malassezia japonica]WFD38151.1 hypothetical protein MJAP1_001099 [Malassezia japonica]